MDIEQFVKDVLAQIARSVNQNEGDGVSYTVDPNKGIDFDLAVVTASGESSAKGMSGGVKIKVVGADASKNITSHESQQVTSRIKFNVILD